MNMNDSTVMRMATSSMRYNMQRQNELARNIANIDTPGFAARDLKPLDFEHLAAAEANRLNMRATAPTHMEGFSKNSGPFKDEATRRTFESTPLKNNVVLEQQMAKVNETGINYQLASNIYSKMQGMFKIAIGNKG